MFYFGWSQYDVFFANESLCKITMSCKRTVWHSQDIMPAMPPIPPPSSEFPQLLPSPTPSLPVSFLSSIGCVFGVFAISSVFWHRSTRRPGMDRKLVRHNSSVDASSRILSFCLSPCVVFFSECMSVGLFVPVCVCPSQSIFRLFS